ncbi:hypothetical protein HNQ77_000321 [Silvibacterium bohemicum]|uniref:Uncharacterized protein n=1 Tax=Silvibacterium bohemicum TaxID=1577686 RepID=A0A841JMC2_9BACT|nr:hypothetical protein [Silvibacterium bohemicum]MBB6142383.1 hypothetical protein [Silvibacterium bohemicum]
MNMRELRDTRKLKAWLRAGKSIELRDRDLVIGRIVPEEKVPSEKDWPDFEARHRELFGDRVFNAVENFLEDRHGRY